MKFLVDAHLPRRLVTHLRNAGQDALHTLDLPGGNRTTDHEINTISEREGRVVITKDADFVNSFFVTRKPYKLVLISTGNITNSELEAVFVPNIPVLIKALNASAYVELSRTALIIHI